MPSLFTGIEEHNLTCETCIKAKSHHVPYHISLNKSTISFSLIHSDVWGHSSIYSIIEYIWFVLFIDDCTRMT
jgi:Integrase core domain